MIAVTEGHAIVGLCFLYLDAAQASLDEVMVRTKGSAMDTPTSDEMENFGLTATTQSEEKVIDDGRSTLSAAAISGAVLGGLLGVVRMLKHSSKSSRIH